MTHGHVQPSFDLWPFLDAGRQLRCAGMGQWGKHPAVQRCGGCYSLSMALFSCTSISLCFDAKSMSCITFCEYVSVVSGACRCTSILPA